MADTLVERDGKLFLLSEDPKSSEPIIFRRFYPTGVRAADYREYVGSPVQPDNHFSNGVYRVEKGDWFTSPKFRLLNGGKTIPEYCEEIPAPPPRVRKGIQTRWNCGRWEKLLKSGWTLA